MNGMRTLDGLTFAAQPASTERQEVKQPSTACHKENDNKQIPIRAVCEASVAH
jgi:hypothetical protein